MIDFSRKVLAYTHGLDKTGFVESGLKYDATLRNLELISEAATRTEVSRTEVSGFQDNKMGVNLIFRWLSFICVIQNVAKETSRLLK